MTNKPSFYAITPATVRYHKALCPNSKLLYGEITALCNEQGFCWANNHYFAELYEVEKNTVSRWISALEKEGFITSEIDKAKGNKRKLFINDPSLQKSRYLSTKKDIGSQQKSGEPIYKNVEHNNTINNTSNNKEREARALDFLKENYQFRFEQFEMQHKKQIKDYEKFCLDFNDVADQEELKFEGKILFARLNRYARNWVDNQRKYTSAEDEKPVKAHPSSRKIRFN